MNVCEYMYTHEFTPNQIIFQFHSIVFLSLAVYFIAIRRLSM